MTLFGRGVQQRRRQHRDDPVRASAPPADAAGSRAESGAAGSDESTVLLRRRWYRLRFPAALERKFEEEQASARRWLLFIVSVFGVLLYVAYAFSDPNIMSDIASMSWKIRLSLTLLMLLGVFAMWLPLKSWLHETLFALFALSAALTTGYVAAHSHAPAALNHAASMLLPPMFVGIVARLRFRYTLAMSLATLAGFVVFIRPHSPVEVLIVRDDLITIISAMAFSLVANYMLEHRERSAFLLDRMQRRQSKALADANERLQQLALLDGLTGITNRRGFEDELGLRWREAQAADTPLSFLMVDLDFFKLYNDSYGHPAGDACLRQTAAVLSAMAAKHGASAARIGGEEFALLLPKQPARPLALLADSICAAVRDLNIPHRLSPIADRVTVSVGCATAEPARGGTVAELMEAADQALYRAKTAGRNRVATAAASMQESIGRLSA